jgi:SAM-dependent methyltransferase
VKSEGLNHPPAASGASPVSSALYREIGAGGFSSIDGSLQFYGRVNALLSDGMSLLDFGAGRGKDATDDPIDYRRRLRTLKGKVRMVVGADIDPIVRDNPSLDHAVQIEEWRGLPFASESFDLLLCDHTFEHVRFPGAVAAELGRVLKRGGWICARTPNRWGYIAIGARLVPNRFHKTALRVVQPFRQPCDVFPTVYKLNTLPAINRHFPSERYRDCSYFYNPEPAYFGASVTLNGLAATASRHLPIRYSAVLMIFKQKL